MDMLINYRPIHIVSPASFDPGTAQTPGSVRLAAVAPQLGRVLAKFAGARGGMHRESESRRFHPRAGLPAAHGDQSVGCGAFSLGRRQEHVNANRGQSSG